MRNAWSRVAGPPVLATPPRRGERGRAWGVALALLLLLPAVVGAGILYMWSVRQRFQAPLERAQALLEAGEYDAALAGFEAARLARPDDPAPLRGQAACFLAKSQFAAAAEMAEKAIAAAGASPEARAEARVLAAEIALVEAGGWDPLSEGAADLADERRIRLRKALEYAQAAVDDQPESASAHRVLAEARARLGDAAGALLHIRRALALAPDDRAVRMAAADVFVSAGRLPEALDQCRQAAKGLDVLGGLAGRDKADLLRAVSRAARVATKLKAGEQAASLWHTYLAAGGDRAQGQTGLLIARYVQGDYARAIEEGDRALRASKEVPWEVHYYRGLAFFELGRYDRSAQEFRVAATIRDDAPTQHMLGRALLRSGDATGARDALLAALTQDPRHQAARRDLVGLYEAGGEVDAALAELQRGVAATPAARGPRQDLADFCLRHGREAEAEEALQALCRLRPPAPEAAEALGLFYLQRFQPEKALPLALEAHRLGPGSPARLHLIARAEAALGHTEKAIAHFEEALRLDPQYAPAYADWAAALQAAGRRDLAEDVLQRGRKAAPSSLELRCAQARFWIATGREQEGVDELKRRVESDRLALLPRVALVDYFLAKNARETALAQAKEGVDALPRDFAALNLLARVHRARGEWDRVRGVLSEMARLPGGEARVLAQRLAAHARDGFYEAARKVADDTLHKQPQENARTALPHAVVRFLSGELGEPGEEALRAVERLRADDPRDPDAAVVLLLMQLVRRDEARPPSVAALGKPALPGVALEALAALVRRNESRPDLGRQVARMLLHAYLYEHAGWFDTAAEQAEEILRVMPDCLPACWLAPVLWERAGDRARAIAVCERALQHCEGFARGRLLLGDLLLLDGQAERARAAYAEGAASENAPPFELRTKLALAAAALGDGPGAAETWRSILRVEPRQMPACNNLACSLAAQPAPALDEAAALAQNARDAAGDHPSVLDTVGWIAYLRGEWQRALDALGPSVDAAPHRAAAHFHLGVARARNPRDAEAARSALKTALELAPQGVLEDTARRVLRELELDDYRRKAEPR